MTTSTVSPLRQRMIEDMNARKLCAGTQRGHIRSCKRFAAFLKRSPDTATFEDIRRFQLHLAETGLSICSRNVIMTGLRFLFRVTLRRLDLAAEIYHLRQPQTIPLTISVDEAKRLLAVADSLLLFHKRGARDQSLRFDYSRCIRISAGRGAASKDIKCVRADNTRFSRQRLLFDAEPPGG